MKDALLHHLACPECRGALTLAVDAREGQEIERGRLRCGPCAREYQILRGVPRFVDTDTYVGSFSFQWNVHRTTQVDSLSGHAESRKTFLTKTGLAESALKGKLVLDVGCGTGRFMEIAAEQGAEVIGLDLSFAVDAAYTNMGRRPGIHIVQADVFKPPFRPDTFDAIYSIGVLHHTPSTREAFLSLPPLLKPAGFIAIWVYVWGGLYSQRLDRVRSLTVGLPERLLYGLCWMFVPLLHAFSWIPILGRLTNYIPTSNQGRGLAWDVMDTFDVYSPRYQWKHTEPEVVGWFKEAKLNEIMVLNFPVSVRGRRAGT